MSVDTSKSQFTPQDIGELAGVSDAYIRQLLLSGELKGHKHGNTWAITRTEVKRFLQERGKDLQ